MEHRQRPRLSADFEVVLRSRNGQRIEAHVLDTTDEGMRLVPEAMTIPARVVVDVFLPADKQYLYGTQQVKGYVVYAQDGKMGVWIIGRGES